MTIAHLNRTIKRIRDVLRTDPGVDGDAQRLAQVSWLLFFRAASEAASAPAQWPGSVPSWRDYRDRYAFSPSGMVEYTNSELLPQLKATLSTSAPSLAEVAADFANLVTSDELLAELVSLVDTLPLSALADRHAVGDFYENMLAQLQNAGTAGEFYTPRALTKLMAQIVRPRDGERVIDPASGSGGFLISILEQCTEVLGSLPKGLQLHSREKKSLPHLLCATNLLLHGWKDLDYVRKCNPLADFSIESDESSSFDVVITNPPFGGEEEVSVGGGFPSAFRTRETSLLFVIYAIDRLRPGGRAAIVMPDGFLFADGTAARVRQELLDKCDLHTIIRLPPGVFAPYTGIKSNILVFEKGARTSGVWIYEHRIADAKTYSKTRPITLNEIAHVIPWIQAGAGREAIESSIYVPMATIKEKSFSLDFRIETRSDFNFPQEAERHGIALDSLNDSINRVASSLSRWAAPSTYVRALIRTWDPLESTCRHASLSIL